MDDSIGAMADPGEGDLIVFLDIRALQIGLIACRELPSFSFIANAA